jgi:GMP synthase-like glutamine amidotransferase
MKSGFNGGAQSVSADQLVSWLGTKVTRLMTCSWANDDITNMRPGQGLVATTAHKAGCAISKSPDRVYVC